MAGWDAQRAGPKIAFVAGGGAVKAYAYHLGVLEGLKADGFFFAGGTRDQPLQAPAGRWPVGCYVGASAGALVAAALASGKPLQELRAALSGTATCAPRFGYRTLFVPARPRPLRYLHRLWRRQKMTGVGLHHLFDLGGLFTTAGVERYFRRHVLPPANRFDALAVDLYLTATKTDGARKVVFGPVPEVVEGDGTDCAYYDDAAISQALAASVSVPPLFRPHTIVNPRSGRRYRYYDGEVREPLSLHVARDIGAEFVIASTIWSPYCWDDRFGTVADLGMSVLAEQALHQINEQKVQRDRHQVERFDRLLQAIDAHHARCGLRGSDGERFKDEVCRLLGHRPQQTLYVEPDPADRAFFLGGAFRFNQRLIDRAVDVGRRAYRYAVDQNPGFFTALRQHGASPRRERQPAAALVR